MARLCLFSLFAVLVFGTSMAFATTPWKLSLGQYRISDDFDQSYWFSSLGLQYRAESFKYKLSLPYVVRDQAETGQSRSGLGNGTLKFTYLSRFQTVYVDIHAKQKLATAHKDVTLPVHDRGLSLELSGRVAKGVWFAEWGYWWREKTTHNRANTQHATAGAVFPIVKRWIGGVIVDHKPSPLGDVDQSVSGIAQFKITRQQTLAAYVGKGMTDKSVDWISGILWSSRF